MAERWNIGLLFLSAALLAGFAITAASAQRAATARAVESNAEDDPVFETRVIDFETIPGEQTSRDDNPLAGVLRRAAPVNVKDQFRESHGVVFNDGVFVFLCQNRIVRVTACPLPRAASGLRAAAFDPRSSRQLEMRFDAPVFGVSVKMTSGAAAAQQTAAVDVGSEYTVLLSAFDEKGGLISESYQDFYARGPDGPHWEDEFFIGARSNSRIPSVARVTIRVWLSGDENETPRAHLFDDVKIYAPAASDEPPVYADLNRVPFEPKLEDFTPARFRRVSPANENYDYYAQAPRYRAPIDWDRAFAAVARQNNLGIETPVERDTSVVDRLQLPFLLSTSADPATVRVFGRDDSFDASYRVGDAEYSIEGTRVLTEYRPQEPTYERGVEEPNLKFEVHSYGLSATFSVYGAAYAVHRYCKGDSPRFDRDCLDRTQMRDHLKTLAVAVGARGRARP